jgi:hypothetical protein
MNEIIETPVVFSRDERGLVADVEYRFKSNGMVDWRAMVNPAHLVINRQYEEDLTKRFGRSLKEISPLEVEDRYLLILLAGIKELAQLRGYSEVRPEVKYVSDTKCVVQTQIEWLPNFETATHGTSFGDVGAASLENVKPDFHPYLETIAANRAFVRAVRNFLGIHIVGNDEIKMGHVPVVESTESSCSGSVPHLPIPMLKRSAEEAKLGFDELKAMAAKKYKSNLESDPAKWTGFESVPARDCLSLVQIIRSSLLKK